MQAFRVSMLVAAVMTLAGAIAFLFWPSEVLAFLGRQEILSREVWGWTIWGFMVYAALWIAGLSFLGFLAFLAYGLAKSRYE